MDQVQDIISRWAVECPEIDVNPIGVSARILLLGRVLSEHCDSALAGIGLTLWQYDVLAALRRAGKPYRLSPTQLARAVTLSTAAMTNRLDRLEAKGWIRRETDPKDRRGLQIELTPAACELVERALPIRVEADRKVLAALPHEAQRNLADLLRALLEGFGQSTGGGSAPGVFR